MRRIPPAVQAKLFARLTYLYAGLVVIVWLCGVFGPPLTTPVSIVILIPPVVFASYLWVMDKKQYAHEDPSVERLRTTLQTEKLQSEGIISAIDDAVCIINQEGIVKHVNARFLEFVNSQESDLLERHFTHPMVVKKRVEIVQSSVETPSLGHNVAQVFATGEPVVIERETIAHVDTGKVYDLRISLLPLTNEDGVVSALMIIGRDISEFIRVQRLKDEFITTASHELRTPATALDGYLELLAGQSGTSLSDEQQGYVRESRHATRRLIAMINDMIDMSNLEAGKFGDTPEKIAVQPVVQRVVDAMSARYEQKHGKYTVDVALETLDIDVRRFELLLHHLLDNASKFAPDNGQVLVRVVANGDDVVVEVSDSGTGIAEEDRVRVFDKFVKIDETGATPGAGLGLAICRRIVEDWGGSIKITAQESGETVVVATIPQAPHTTHTGSSSL